MLLLVAVALLPPVDVPTHSRYEMLKIAESLARNGGFADPFEVLPTGPTAVEPPVYPLYLAFWMKLCRDLALMRLTCGIVNIFAGAITAVLLHALIKRRLGSTAATFAAALWIASSWMGSSATWVLWDAALTGLILVAFCYATEGDAADRFAGRYLMPGGLLGLLFLLNPATILIACAWLGFRVLFGSRGRMSPRQALGILAVAAAVGSPWIMRNSALWGRVVVRTNFGMTLFASNNACAEPGLYGDLEAGCYQRSHPNDSIDEARLLRRLGEPAYDRLRTAAALHWIRTNRRRFARLTAQRIRLFWFPEPAGVGARAYVTWALSLLLLPGLFWMWRRREPLAVFVTAAALLYPLVYYVVVAGFRYRAPLAWIAVIPAAWLGDQLYRRARPLLARRSA